MDFNSPGDDWIEFGLGLVLGLATILIAALVRYASSLVMRVDVERTLLRRRDQDDSHVIVGEYKFLSLLGAPHIVRTRSFLGFASLVAVVIGTTAFTLASFAFSGSRQLRTGEGTVKVTARPGDALMDEDKIEKFADWFRSSGVVSACQRREGSKRVFFQPYVEAAEGTRIFCGKRLNVGIAHENEEFLEKVGPSSLRIADLAGVVTSTPHSRYMTHEVTINGNGLLAVCNSGEFYRGLRAGRISQSCAFTTKTRLVLGGYDSNQTELAGPGQEPSLEDVEYFDSYTVDHGVELNKAQLMQALTLWDLGCLSEVEVAVLSTLTMELESGVASFTGGFERLQVDLRLLIVGVSIGGAMLLWMGLAVMWDGFTRTNEEHFRTDVSTVPSISRIMRTEATGVMDGDNPDAPLNNIALRDVTPCNCKQDGESGHVCSVPRRYHVGSASFGRPTTETRSRILASLHHEEAEPDRTQDTLVSPGRSGRRELSDVADDLA